MNVIETVVVSVYPCNGWQWGANVRRVKWRSYLATNASLNSSSFDNLAPPNPSALVHQLTGEKNWTGRWRSDGEISQSCLAAQGQGRSTRTDGHAVRAAWVMDIDSGSLYRLM